MNVRLILVALTSVIVAACEPSHSKEHEVVAMQTTIAVKCFAAGNLWSVFANENPNQPSPIPRPLPGRDWEMSGVRGMWEMERIRRSPNIQAEYERIIALSKKLKKRPEAVPSLIKRCEEMEDADQSFQRSIPRLLKIIRQPPVPAPT